MKKIMFNDRYGLEQAVLNGWKAMTRRAIPNRLWKQWDISQRGTFGPACVSIQNEQLKKWMVAHAPMKVGEVVAVAQRYTDITWHCNPHAPVIRDFRFMEELRSSKGWRNKMYVKAELMPCRIKITSVRVERLQEITDEDILKEGIRKHFVSIKGNGGIFKYSFSGEETLYYTARGAFHHLIDLISPKGSRWEDNPWVFVYGFEKIV